MTPLSEKDELELNAWFDGELDPIASRRFEERLAAEPELAKRRGELEALRAAFRGDGEADNPAVALREKIEREFAPPVTRWSRSWQAMAASLVVGLALGSLATFGILQTRTADPVAPQVVAAHIRALMAPEPVDIASSDHHTVKPWFDGKLAFAPTVIDLAAKGFPLVGGRVDVIGLEPAPALIYRAGKHLISLIEMPSEARAASVTRGAERGFETLTWSDGRTTYWAVSDANDAELTNFVGAFQAASGSP